MRSHALKYTVLSFLGLLAVAAFGQSKPSPQTKPSISPDKESTVQAEFFETKVRPLLVAQCVSCHGASQQLGGLRLDTRAGLLKGGSRGAAVVAGKPDQSLLIQAVHYADANLKMPPSGKLADDKIQILEQWIRLGAFFPEDSGKKPVPQTLWSLRSIKKPTLPKVKTPAWISNPIDAFVLAKLESKAMTPALPAGKRELMRRVTFDLTGLPPTPAEVASYLADKSPNAYENLVDRLLASPRYGERWARYWLDLVRYADSNGYERDAEKPYSWKYRDYVIEAFNSDKPYNRFIMEQLAGDELPYRSEETVTATGFLRLGTWDDEPNDPLEYKYERLDDLVHASSAAFLGLTVRCARCHDHKFDPISQKDYYAFAASFWGGYLEPADGKLLGGPPKDKLGYAVLGFTDKGREVPALKLLRNGDPRKEEEAVAPGSLSAITQVKANFLSPPADAQTTHRRLQLAQWLTDPRHPLTARVWVNRVWQHHFGQGLVRTPNNYGTKGALPTHPELLDYLASKFVAQGKDGFGWHCKPLHKLILMSNTYRMASVHPKQAAYERKDFLNENLWRMNRQRLDADALRDSILTVSGQINLKMGGQGFMPTVTKAALEGLSKKGAEWVPSAPEEQNRRTVYVFLKRALIAPLLTTFDFADTTQPVEQRDVTTVAPQALALMNNPFVNAQSDMFARRIEAEAGIDRTKQVIQAWRLALGRSPSEAERTAALAYLKQFPAQRPLPNDPTTQRPDALKTGLRLWLRADQGVTAGTDGRVSAWVDQSGQGHDAVQSVFGAKPFYTRTTFHGKWALRFDGKSKFMTFAEQILTSQQFSLFAVASDRTKNGAHREIFSNWNSKDNVGTSLFFGTTGESSVRLSDAFAPAGTLAKPQEPFVLTGIASENEVTVYQNRTEIAKLASALPTRNLAAPYVLGQQGNINGEFWGGDIYELLVYDRALAPAETMQIWEMLNQRYGIAPIIPPADRALTSLCHVLFNMNEFVYID